MKIYLFSFCLLLFIVLTNAHATEIRDLVKLDEVDIEQEVETSRETAQSEVQQKNIEETFQEEQAKTFELIGATINPGEKVNLKWSSIQSLLGNPIENSVIVINGAKPGPILALTAAIHGDELNGIEMIRQVVHDIDPIQLNGVIVAVPIVNLEGFWRKDRYIGDRRDLNRYFPGNLNGSYPARVAHSIFTQIINKCDIVVDLHTGSFFRENLPQLRVDLNVEQVSKLATGFGAITALQSTAPLGSLRGAATAAGIPAIVMEIGGPLSLETDKVTLGVESLRTFLQSVGMIDKVTFWPTPQPVFYKSEWLRAHVGGILINKVKLGDTVQEGMVLAEITNPLTNKVYEVTSHIDGSILGRAQNQFVSPGFGLFHIGHKKSVEEIEEEIGKEKKE